METCNSQLKERTDVDKTQVGRKWQRKARTDYLFKKFAEK